MNLGFMIGLQGGVGTSQYVPFLDQWMFFDGTLDEDGKVQNRRSFSDWMFNGNALWLAGVVDDTRDF